jgi:hypothetical protein
MANRAYLFSSDRADYNSPHLWTEYVNARRYYDSRWTVPFAWFFLYLDPDLKMVEQEPKFFAPRSEALANIRDKMPLLLEVAGPEFDSKAVMERFVKTIGQWQGKYFLLEPFEIFQDDEQDFVNSLRILRRIAEPNATARDVIEALGEYVHLGFCDQAEFEMLATGVTYW